MLKLLFCGLKYEYGKAFAGLSFEHQNFFEVLSQIQGIEAEMFAVDEVMQSVGRDEMNKKLIQKVEADKPDLLFCFLFTEELKKETIEHITKKTSTKTFNWFADDHWRFPIYSKYWAPLFTAVSTTDSQAVEKYKTVGVDAIKTQWAANVNLYKPSQYTVDSKQYVDITFVGKNYGNRAEYIQTLKDNHISAEGYGSGWEKGRVDFTDMLEIFSNSKVNLNFTESYFNWPKQLVKLFVKKEFGRYYFNAHHLVSNFQSLLGAKRKQIKGRIFEVPACGGFLITGDADNLRDYYVEDKEIVIFKDKNDLVEKCKYYLAHDSERQAIAKAGYERTIKEHTYEQRFKEIFKTLDLM